jgi:pimeloyl-ACP methyl ester carboxylesterase
MRLCTHFHLLLTTCLATACVSQGKRTAAYDDYPVSYPEMVRMLAKEPPHLSTFEHVGPFETRTQANLALDLGDGEVLSADLVAPKGGIEAPVAIFVHGNHSQKEAHRYQAARLASFGIYALSVQVPSRGQWIENGRLIERLARALRERPALVHQYADTRNIVLIGHSFGGSAVTVAASRGAPVKGLVLLDPAVYSAEVMKAMRKVRQPVMLLGADFDVFHSRKRRLFYQHIGGEMGELSVVGATHDDAQNPSMQALSTYGLDPYTSREHQELFTAAIAATVLSLTSTGKLDNAWTAFADAVEHGDFKDPRRRAARAAAR